MKKLFFSLLLCAGVSEFQAQQYSLPALSSTQKTEQQFSIGKLTLEYARPNVKGRKIFGELVPYGKVWRLGANAATRLTISQPLTFGNVNLKPGTYAVYAVPSEKEWKILFNKGVNNWGTFGYKETEDVASLTVPVQTLAQPVETFQIGFENIQETTMMLVMAWDRVRIEVPVSVTDLNKTTRIQEALKQIKAIEKEGQQAIN